MPCVGEKRNACRILVGKPEGMRPLGRLRHRWKDNIKMCDFCGAFNPILVNVEWEILIARLWSFLLFGICDLIDMNKRFGGTC
jgi:hypothetical protein